MPSNEPNATPADDRPHVVLVRPPLRVPKASYSTLACPPVAVAYLAAAVEQAGQRVTVVDALGEAPRRFTPIDNPRFLRLGLSDAETVARVPADATCIGVTSMFSEEWPMVRGLVQSLRAAFPNTPIVAGGEHITAAPEFAIRDSGAIDVCVLGEGEETLVDLARELHTRGSVDTERLTHIAGLAFLADDTLVRTPRRARIRGIDELPWPAWHHVPLDNYLDNGLAYGIGRVRSVPIMATRGCPYQCTFCSNVQMWGTRWVARDPADVVAEMTQGVARYKAENFDFYDLTAVLKKAWILEFCALLVEADLGVTFQIPSGTRSEVLDREVLEALMRAGCHHIVYAPESGSPAVLKRIKKRIDLERMTASMATAVSVGMTVKCNFIIGFPDETLDEVLETVAYCRRLARVGVQDINLGPFCPYPGSETYDALVDSGSLPPMSDDYFDMLAMYSDLANTVSFSNHLSSRQLSALRTLGMASFYSAAFARRPQRVVDTLRNVATGEHTTRLDRALGDMTRRMGDVVGERATRLLRYRRT